jgi:phenolic acid decarboxylase
MPAADPESMGSAGSGWSGMPVFRRSSPQTKGIPMTISTSAPRNNGQRAACAAPAAQDLSGIVGHRIVYTYDNGWKNEMYIKNATTIDYHVHSGDVGGRVVKGQPVDLVQLDDDHYKLSWTEPTGTSVAVNYMPVKRRVHGSTFFPQWVAADGSKIAVYQNDHLDQMWRLRAAGPTYPIEVITEFTTIASFAFVGVDDESVIPVPTEVPDLSR